VKEARSPTLTIPVFRGKVLPAPPLYSNVQAGAAAANHLTDPPVRPLSSSRAFSFQEGYRRCGLASKRLERSWRRRRSASAGIGGGADGTLKRLVDAELTPGSPEYALADLVRAAPVFERTSCDRERILARVRIAAASPRRRVWSVAAAATVLSIAGLSLAAAGRLWLSKPAASPSPVTSSAASPVAYPVSAPTAPPVTAAQADLPSAGQPLAEPPTTAVSPSPRSRDRARQAVLVPVIVPEPRAPSSKNNGRIGSRLPAVSNVPGTINAAR
jgi:hypothetical protein